MITSHDKDISLILFDFWFLNQNCNKEKSVKMIGVTEILISKERVMIEMNFWIRKNLEPFETPGCWQIEVKVPYYLEHLACILNIMKLNCIYHENIKLMK